MAAGDQRRGDIYRSTSHRAVAGFWAVICAAGAVYEVVYVAGHSKVASNVVLAVVLALAAAYLVRNALAVVIASPSAPAVRVRNPMRTHVVPWGEIASFGHQRALLRGSSFQRELIVLRRKDGGCELLGGLSACVSFGR